jgi:metallophosphoesterase (TIGR00282 family)
MIGDVAGKPGVRAVKQLLPRLTAEYGLDFVVANGENAAGGVGLTPRIAEELLAAGVHCITTGNHVWRQSELRDFIAEEQRLLRPLNYPASQPGQGLGLYETPAGIRVGVLNLVGQIFMDPADSPFAAAESALEKLAGAQLILVDIHAEATSEKKALGQFLDGRVTAVAGTHTHVQTADEQILKQGTAFITDIGMTGPHDSVIGMRTDSILKRFTTRMPTSFNVAKKDVRLQALLITAELPDGRAVQVERLDLPLEQ